MTSCCEKRILFPAQASSLETKSFSCLTSLWLKQESGGEEGQAGSDDFCRLLSHKGPWYSAKPTDTVTIRNVGASYITVGVCTHVGSREAEKL